MLHFQLVKVYKKRLLLLFLIVIIITSEPHFWLNITILNIKPDFFLEFILIFVSSFFKKIKILFRKLKSL
ncbi:hypothetical protein D0T56_13305 [Dysgonomonas sp. 520]|nr:hypothetical protein [Dysgonomonas sp. 520]